MRPSPASMASVRLFVSFVQHISWPSCACMPSCQPQAPGDYGGSTLCQVVKAIAIICRKPAHQWCLPHPPSEELPAWALSHSNSRLPNPPKSGSATDADVLSNAHQAAPVDAFSGTLHSMPPWHCHAHWVHAQVLHRLIHGQEEAPAQKYSPAHVSRASKVFWVDGKGRQTAQSWRKWLSAQGGLRPPLPCHLMPAGIIPWRALQRWNAGGGSLQTWRWRM